MSAEIDILCMQYQKQSEDSVLIKKMLHLKQFSGFWLYKVREKILIRNEVIWLEQRHNLLHGFTRPYSWDRGG